MPRPVSGSSRSWTSSGFAPSPAARRLSLGRTLTVGVVVSFLTRPQAAERLRGVDAVLTDSEFDLVIYNVESVQKRDHYLATLAHSQRTDGLLVMSLPPRAEAGAILSRAPGPRGVHRRPHAVGRGHAPRDRRRHRGRRTRRPAPARSRPPRDRLRRRRGRGPVRVHLQPGPRARASPRSWRRRAIALPPEWIGHGAHGRYEARDLARRMLLADRRPTAIFAASDTQALGVIAAAQKLGLRRARRPVSHRLRRHRGRRLRRR